VSNNHKFDSTYEGKKFLIDRQPTYIFSGEFHYFRTPHELWDDRLLKCRRMLVNTVASYIPWNWHERQSGKFDFKEDRDVGLFVDKIKDNKLMYIARPGPYICAEWDTGSVPQWIQNDTHYFRTMNPKFLKYVARWYDHINKILAPRLRNHDGNIVIYQIENEDWWCDTRYALELLKMVRDDGISCPVISNENPKNRGTEIIDTLDDYPLPWQPNSPYMFIPDGMEGKIRKLLDSQPDKPAMHTEFETGWYTEFGSCAPSKWLGDVPPEWIEVLLKSVMAEGVNAINMYMVAGGMNYGYWGSRNCTTDRDWIAPIHDWGGLNDSFYNVRRFGGMLKTLGADLVNSNVDASLSQTPEGQISIFARKGEKSVYVCPRSLSGKSADLHFTIPNVPGYGTLEFPLEGSYHLNGQTMAILPVNVRLHKELPPLVYSTAELFALLENDHSISLIVSGDKHQKVELAFDGKLDLTGDCTHTMARGWTIISAEISSKPQVVRVLNRSKDVHIVFVDKYTAGRTWDCGWDNGSMPLVSNLYLLREDAHDENSLELLAESRPDSSIFMQFPVMEKPISAYVDDKKVEVKFDADKKIASIDFTVGAKNAFSKELVTGWRCNKETIPPAADRKWKPYQKWLGVEKHGEYEGGYYYYRTTFIGPKEVVPLTIKLTRFWDEASVFLNGQFIDASRNNLTCDVTHAVRFGEINELVLVVEDWGHWEHGFAEETGIVGPVVISAAELTLDLIHWKRFAVETYEEPWNLDCSQPEAMPDFDDSEWKDVLVKKNWDSRIHGTWRGKDYHWYRTKVKLPDSLAEKQVRLDFGECRDECWLYVNGKFVKWLNWFRIAGEPFSVDITDFIDRGKENTIAILVLVKWHGQGGLHQKMQLVASDNLVDGDWEYLKGLNGELYNYPDAGFDDSSWEEQVPATEIGSQEIHGIHWMRTRFDLDLPKDWVMPMGLVIRGFEKKVNLYINGHFLGRYRSEGPQEKYYIPEPWLKAKENSVTLMVDGWKPGMKIGQVGLESFPITKKLNIKINLS